MIQWSTSLALAWCGLIASSALGAPAHAGTTRPATPVRPVREFTIVTEAQAQSAAFGMLMICPSHAHGTQDDAERKLRLLVKPGSEQPSTIWTCRGSQIETVRRFAPLVERVVVNPFGHWNTDRPKGGEAYWPGINHPVLNGLQEIRLAAGDRQLLACLDLDGEAMLFGQRSASFEEIEWQLYAVIGSGYQGVVWRNQPSDDDRASRLRRLEERLRPVAGTLAGARPVPWVRAKSAHPMAALQGEEDLLVVLLNPDYVVPGEQKRADEGVRLPLEDREQQGALELTMPRGRAVVSARTLSGKILRADVSGDRVTIAYRFRGGGEMVICRLSGAIDGVD